MKNIQVIDGAMNCSHSIYEATDEEYALIFPDGQDIEFEDDLFSRVEDGMIIGILENLWKRPVEKKSVQGIHGTLFYELGYKKEFYPTKKESEMVTPL